MDGETLAKLHELDDGAAEATLMRCCGCARWARALAARRPFADAAALHAAADEEWAAMGRADILEAFSHHPRIGADIDELRAKFAATATWSSGEQAGVESASEDVLARLRDGNVAYEARYGFIFIVCASGKSAAQMLALLEARMDHSLEEELAIAAAEQAKITRLRLSKLAL